MPGPPSLTIECWDNLINSADNLIGSTTINIENRWYDQYWRNLQLKPIETRTIELYNMPCGKLKLWIDLLTIKQKQQYPDMIDISQPANDSFELRLIIWECKNIPFDGEYTDIKDLYCLASFGDGSYQQQTDWVPIVPSWKCCGNNNYKSLKANAMFNWRMKFPIKSLDKYKRQSINVQVCTNDYFFKKGNVCESFISLNEFLTFCEIQNMEKRFIWTENSDEHIRELPLTKRGKVVGTITITMELLPRKLIKKYPAGFGRGEPNLHPYLQDPLDMKKLPFLPQLRSLCLTMGVSIACICLLAFFVMLFIYIFV
eukprot:432502_1